MRRKSAFTVLELLVAVSIFSLILMVVLSVIGQASSVWRRATDKVETFQGARAAFEMLTRHLSQATLNSYLDYDDSESPRRYLRKSELRFLIAPVRDVVNGAPNAGEAVFFQAPANRTAKPQELGGLEALLNTCGYFVTFNDDTQTKPKFVSGPVRYRFRLMQLIVPAEKNAVYTAQGNAWFANDLSQAMPAAENIIALILRPQEPGAEPPDLTTNYVYDTAEPFQGEQPKTSHQLPPVVQVTMVAIDEASAKRLENDSTPPEVITSALNGRFLNTADYENDLKQLEEALNGATPPIGYRIFTSAVPLRESKWSK